MAKDYFIKYIMQHIEQLQTAENPWLLYRRKKFPFFYHVI